eukprot:3820125-Lingulodinium_polyedra.AAC.1
MGWSWAFWFVQKPHEAAADRAGFAAPSRLVASWPAPQLSLGAAALPYCDNLTVFGTIRDE